MRLPDPPSNIDPQLASFLRQVLGIIEIELTKLAQTKAYGWSPQNVPTTSMANWREFDASSADLDTTRKALSVFIKDLTIRGDISKVGK